MTIRLAVMMLLVALSFSACIPGSDRGESVSYDGESSEEPLEARASDWFMHNKVERLPYSPLPPRMEDGSLPRSIGSYTLLGNAPSEGKEYRDDQKIFYVEEISKNRRMRVFSRDDYIFRVQAFTRLSDLEASDAEGLMRLIKEKYGQPDLEFMAELTYVDDATVVQFSISADFLVTDLMDISTTELPNHILALVDKKQESR